MIVVVDIHAIAVPCPIAAAVEVVIGNHPIRVVVEHDAARPVINAPGDKYLSDVFVASSRIGAACLEAVVVGIPIGVGVARIVPAFVLAIIVAIAVVIAIFVLVAAFMLAIVVVVGAILMRGGDRQRSGQSHKNHTCQDFSHTLFLQDLRWRRSYFCQLILIDRSNRFAGA